MCLLALCGIFISCAKEDKIIINSERHPCEFTASRFLSNVDDSPMTTKSSSYRMVDYVFESLDGTDVVEGTILENTTFRVKLQKKVYNVKLITDSIYDDWLSHPNVTIPIGVPRFFTHTENVDVNTLVNGTTKTFTLKHLSGKYVAKVDSIPIGHEVVLEVLEYKNGYNWLTEIPSVVSLLPGESTASIFVGTNGDLYSRYVVGGTTIKVKVGVRLIGSSTNIRELEYEYLIPKATIRTVTYTVKGEDFIVTVDDTFTEMEETQEVGEPQV